MALPIRQQEGYFHYPPCVWCGGGGFVYSCGPKILSSWDGEHTTTFPN